MVKAAGPEAIATAAPPAAARVPDAAVLALYISAAHVYVDHFGRPAGVEPMRRVMRAEVFPGRGLAGDRFAQRAAGHAGQVTFLAAETWRRLQVELQRPEIPAAVFRRNVLVENVDLLALIGREFEVQGIRFFGTEYCRPCFWMDEAFAPGTLDRLVKWRAGGLRAAALSPGFLVAPAET